MERFKQVTDHIGNPGIVAVPDRRIGAKRPLVNGINSVAFNTGNPLALLLAGLLLSRLGAWRDVIMAIGAASPCPCLRRPERNATTTIGSTE